ncbi:transporter substrate-binding domain-containing protein [Canibacter zhoujuaniae]|uniref:transporter substrate-binding domain-containing protein n=1 Tax=Canibacter zhoujuaniae TaxID=2708343 RepID=UPI00141EA140|nr:transporter substrate-binding domain-containing protein [Canibacter zhoujuaniae]
MKKKFSSVIAAAAIAGLLLSGCANAENNSSEGASSDDVNSILPIADEPSTSANSKLHDMLPEDLKSKGKIDIALDLPFPPMEYYDEDGRIIGVDAELGRLLGQKLDIGVSLNQQAFDSVIPSLQSGRHDITLSGMNDTAERRQALSFVEYVNSGFIILVKKGNPENIKNLNDLCGKKVSLQMATQQGNVLREMDCNIEMTELPDDPAAQEALHAGRVQAYIADAAVAAYAAAETDNGEAFDVIEDPENPAGYDPLFVGIGILKERTELIEAVRAALQELIDEGAYQKVLERYDMGSFAVTEAVVNGER